MIPLAAAEQQWLHAILTASAVAAGAGGLLTRRAPILGPRAGGAIVLVAFGVLVLELAVLGSIPVMALSHFLICVCISRLLQGQTVREQGQFLVLCLLLLMVVSIVSGDLLFPFVLMVYLTVGLAALVRLQLAVEQSRVDRHNRRVDGDALLPAVLPGGGLLAGPVAALGLVLLAVGATLFLFVPRVGAGMLGQLEGHAYAGSATGLSRTLRFEQVGPVLQSERPVMTVRLEDEAGRVLSPKTLEPYFRAMVFDRYARRIPHRGGYWEWQVGTLRHEAPRDVVCRMEGATEEICVLGRMELGPTDFPVIQKYWLQPMEQHYLFACYPAVAIRSAQLTEVRKRIKDQTLQVYPPRPVALRGVVGVVGVAADGRAAGGGARAR